MESLIDSSVNMWDEILNTPTVLSKSIDIKATIKVDYYIFHTFILVAMLLLIIVTILA